MPPRPPSEPDEGSEAEEGASRPAFETLYQERILQHFRRPHGKGTLDHADAEGTVHNPLCGESVTVTLSFDRSAADIRLRDLRFQSDGCSIAQASASMMTDLVRGRTIAEIEDIAGRVSSVVAGDPDAAEDPTLGPAVALSVIRRVPARAACALLAWRALARGLDAGR